VDIYVEEAAQPLTVEKEENISKDTFLIDFDNSEGKNAAKDKPGLPKML